MDAAAPGWLVALEASGAGAAIRQSVWIYPAANVGHVSSIVAFAGAVTVLDLTLLGAIRARARGALISGARRWAAVFLMSVAATGAILFIAEASHVALNPVFQIKLGLIGLGLVNALVLGRSAITKATSLPDDAPLPPTARTAALASLAIWLSVAALGRFIAYV